MAEKAPGSDEGETSKTGKGYKTENIKNISLEKGFKNGERLQNGKYQKQFSQEGLQKRRKVTKQKYQKDFSQKGNIFQKQGKVTKRKISKTIP